MKRNESLLLAWRNHAQDEDAPIPQGFIAAFLAGYEEGKKAATVVHNYELAPYWQNPNWKMPTIDC